MTGDSPYEQRIRELEKELEEKERLMGRLRRERDEYKEWYRRDKQKKLKWKTRFQLLEMKNRSQHLGSIYNRAMDEVGALRKKNATLKAEQEQLLKSRGIE